MWGIKPESTDEAFTGFAAACAAAGPTGCAIATAGSTADSIRQWTRDLLDVCALLFASNKPDCLSQAAYDYKRQAGLAAEVTSARLRSKY
jgi:hypothetical protein